ncbi:MAG: hypothetical protein JO020_33555 [Chloroflexi bacterium]|nr:hypothetical protein [Chloroflexota bacterium]MBV9899110.1 hypothetical protein [Chloroflexota bacterium]
MKFRSGDLEFNASVAETGETRSPQTGNTLQVLTIQFRAQKAGVHEAAVSEALQRQLGGLYSLGEDDAPELEWRVRESNWNYVGSEPWGVNHHIWRIEQVERLACSRLRIGPVIDVEPYDYAETVVDGVVRLAARALVTDSMLVALSRLGGPLEVVRVGISDTPRQMRLSGYVWGQTSEGLAVVLACEDVRQPRVTVAGFDGPTAADIEDLVELTTMDHEEFRRRRHERRQVADVDAWPLTE